MTDPLIARRANPRRTRALQRGFHLLMGVVLAAYVYATPSPDSAAAASVRFILLPLLVASGVIMWQLPRLRRVLRRQRTHA